MILDENLKFVFGDDEKIVPVNEIFIVNGNGKRAYSSLVKSNDDIPNYARLFFTIPEKLSSWNKLGLYDEKTEVNL